MRKETASAEVVMFQLNEIGKISSIVLERIHKQITHRSGFYLDVDVILGIRKSHELMKKVYHETKELENAVKENTEN